MSRKKGTPKTGGRQAGTPNRITTTLKEFISGLIDSNRQQMQADLGRLQPYQRLVLLERLLAYVLPKQQATTQEAVLAAEYSQLQQLIETLPDEAIDRITQKVLELQQANRNEQQGITTEDYQRR